jgi:hypothetical protein
MPCRQIPHYPPPKKENDMTAEIPDTLAEIRRTTVQLLTAARCLDGTIEGDHAGRCSITSTKLTVGQLAVVASRLVRDTLARISANQNELVEQSLAQCTMAIRHGLLEGNVDRDEARDANLLIRLARVKDVSAASDLAEASGLHDDIQTELRVTLQGAYLIRFLADTTGDADKLLDDMIVELFRQQLDDNEDTP